MPPVQQFRVRDKLLKILQTAGAKEKLFSTRQIVTYLGRYIEKKKLHDSRNMRIVRCKGDYLEELFGVQEFAIESFNDMWQFIFPYIIPATNKEVKEHETQCRNKEEGSLGLNDSLSGKIDYQWMSQLPWWFFVEKESKPDENPEVATASGSIVDTSTVCIEDTDYESESNDSRNVRRDHSEEDDHFSVEYEPDSDDSTNSDATEPFVSDDEDMYIPAPLPRSEYSEDTTTTDATDVSMDFDIPLEDHWTCAICKESNSPTVGFCQRCWKLRKGWVNSSLPSSRVEKSQTLPAGEFSEYFTPSLLRSSSQPIPRGLGVDVADGRLKLRKGESGNQSNQSNFNELPFNNPTKRKRGIDWDNDIASTAKRQSSTDEINSPEPPSTSKLLELRDVQTSAPSPPVLTSSSESAAIREELSSSSTRTQSSVFPGLCNICHTNPNDGTIVHGNVGHQFCCCKCAKKLKRKGKTCPVCRQPIALVVKTFFYQM